MEISGGMAPLCARLGVSEHSIALWLAGKARMPDDVFLPLTDLVLADDVARASQDRRVKPREHDADASLSPPTRR